MNKSDAAEILRHYLESNGKAKDAKLKDAVETALADLGKCPSCSGTGILLSRVSLGSGYKVTKVGNRTYFEYPCALCDGTKKILAGHCKSCGEGFAVEPDQIYVDNCIKCEKLNLENGNLLPTTAIS